MSTDIFKLLSHPDIFESGFIDCSALPFFEGARAACEANLCGKYGSCWTCPPGVGGLAELEAKAKGYKRGFVFSCKYDLEDSFDFAGMTEVKFKSSRTLKEITETLYANGVRFLPLGSGGCYLCDSCTYPDSPCRHPDKAIASLEAYGIFVSELAKKVGINYINGQNTVTYFGLILLED